MTYLGIKTLIIEDRPAESGWWILHLSQNGARWHNAAEFAGIGVYQTAATLLERYGDKVAISLIGPGGEMQLSGAGIQNLDKDNAPSRINARGGLGAVMGSKGLKAIIFDKTGCQKAPIADAKAFRAAQKVYNKELMAHPQTQSYSDYGTAAMTRMTNAFGAIPTRNFSAGQFEAAEKISGELCANCCSNEAAPANRPMPVWPVVPSAAPTFLAAKMRRNRIPRSNTKRLACWAPTWASIHWIPSPG